MPARVLGAARRSSRWRADNAAPAIAIGLAGAAGAIARVTVQSTVSATAGRVPWGVALVNISGCFAAGFLVGVLRGRGSSALRKTVPLAGFLASYTTFSTYAVGIDLLIRHNAVASAVSYALLSLVGGLTALMMGMALARCAVLVLRIDRDTREADGLITRSTPAPPDGEVG